MGATWPDVAMGAVLAVMVIATNWIIWRRRR